MPRKVVAVVGGLSVDTILTSNVAVNAGGNNVAAKHEEDGGQATSIAIALWRCLHQPRDEDGLFMPEPRVWADGEADLQVRVVAAVANDEVKRRFTDKLEENGINTDGVRVLGDGHENQDFCTKIFDGASGDITQMYGYGPSNHWDVSDFETIEQIGGGIPPDMVIVTMELKTEIVEQIIKVAHENNIDVVLNASPGEGILTTRYEQVRHLICNAKDAAKMLGYDTVSEINVDTWEDVVRKFRTKGVENVALKVGHIGAVFANDQVQDFVSGYKSLEDTTDPSGSSSAFVAAYVAEVLKHEAGSSWSIAESVRYGNIASALTSMEMGYDRALPWAWQIENFETSSVALPLFADLAEVRNPPPRPRRGGRRRAIGYPGLEQ